jgi:anti-sigma regulatory factor (Ser/Thr protein kinase)
LGDNFRAEVKSLNDVDEILASIENFGKRHTLPVEIIFHLQLACDEFLTNAISYGFPCGEPPQIHLSISFKNNTIQAKIVDNGVPFNPLAQPDLSAGSIGHCN